MYLGREKRSHSIRWKDIVLQILSICQFEVRWSILDNSECRRCSVSFKKISSERLLCEAPVLNAWSCLILSTYVGNAKVKERSWILAQGSQNQFSCALFWMMKDAITDLFLTCAKMPSICCFGKIIILISCSFDTTVANNNFPICSLRTAKWDWISPDCWHFKSVPMTKLVMVEFDNYQLKQYSPKPHIVELRSQCNIMRVIG